MPLTDTFVRTVKSPGEARQKCTDGGGMYLLALPAGKYAQLNYRYLGKRKTLALGVYPEVPLAKARAAGAPKPGRSLAPTRGR
jgi:hypothetical protein